jgi:DNA-binding response OmpR family regulator
MATIVVIDDDRPFAQLLEESLAAEGYRVFKGFDGQMAMRLAKTEHPDLIIMDVNMPLRNGEPSHPPGCRHRAISEQGSTPQAAIIFRLLEQVSWSRVGVGLKTGGKQHAYGIKDQGRRMF